VGAAKKEPLIDFHVHYGYSRDEGLVNEKIIKQLFASLPLSHMVVFPIDGRNPGPSYSKMNDRVARLAGKNKRIIPFARLNPHQYQAALREIKRAPQIGIRGFKFHPRAEDYNPHRAEGLMRAIEELRMPVVLHTSHEHHCHPLIWEGIFLRHPNISFILAHAGKDAHRDAAAVAKRCPNVFLDASTLSIYRTLTILKRVGPDKIVFGSDSPYSHPGIEFYKYNLILGNRWLWRRKIFSANAKKILGVLP